jgi:hypothetical protein
VSYVVVQFPPDGSPPSVVAGAEVFADAADAADARTDCLSALDGTGRRDRYEVMQLVPATVAVSRPNPARGYDR